MPNITEFLLARIAEDEAAAGGAAVEPVILGRSWFDGWSDTHPVGKHIGRWTPARVLAECESKRRIVEQHHREAGGDMNICMDCEWGWPCPTLLLVALPYADHPHYRQEWAL